MNRIYPHTPNIKAARLKFTLILLALLFIGKYAKAENYNYDTYIEHTVIFKKIASTVCFYLFLLSLLIGFVFQNNEKVLKIIVRVMVTAIIMFFLLGI